MQWKVGCWVENSTAFLSLITLQKAGDQDNSVLPANTKALFSNWIWIIQQWIWKKGVSESEILISEWKLENTVIIKQKTYTDRPTSVYSTKTEQHLCNLNALLKGTSVERNCERVIGIGILVFTFTPKYILQIQIENHLPSIQYPHLWPSDNCCFCTSFFLQRQHGALYFVLTAITLYNTFCSNGPRISEPERCWSCVYTNILNCCIPKLLFLICKSAWIYSVFSICTTIWPSIIQLFLVQPPFLVRATV